MIYIILSLSNKCDIKRSLAFVCGDVCVCVLCLVFCVFFEAKSEKRETREDDDEFFFFSRKKRDPHNSFL